VEALYCLCFAPCRESIANQQRFYSSDCAKPRQLRHKPKDVVLKDRLARLVKVLAIGFQKGALTLEVVLLIGFRDSQVNAMLAKQL
jgi:hypothetical protein